MLKPIDTRKYSYRDDDAVPDFPDGAPVVFMDADCVLCSKAARLIVRLDNGDNVRICTVQSELGRAVLKHYGLDAGDPESWLYLEEGLAYSSMDAVIKVGWRLGGIGRFAAVFLVLPRFLRGWIYRVIARNRYKIWGRADMCMLSDERLRQKIIDL